MKKATLPILPKPAKKAGWESIPYTILPADPIPLEAYRKTLSKKPRISPYRIALEQLANAKRGSVLRFDSERAYVGVRKQANKLGYECHYAVKDGELFVQILGTGDDL